MTFHEATEQPNWQTKIVCTCGEHCNNWMEFYRHRGDAYKEQLLVVVTAIRDQRVTKETGQ